MPTIFFIFLFSAAIIIDAVLLYAAYHVVTKEKFFIGKFPFAELASSIMLLFIIIFFNAALIINIIRFIKSFSYDW